MERSDPARFKQPVLLPGLWIPVALLAIGLLVTGVIANREGRQAMALSEVRHASQHQALINRLLASAPGQVPQGRSDSALTSRLESIFDGALPASLHLRVDTLERHTKKPLLEIRSPDTRDPTQARRTEVSWHDRNWIITTSPAAGLQERAVQASNRSIWVAGTALSVLAASLPLLLIRRLHQQGRQIRGLERREIGADHQIANFQVEKAVLRQALNDSEQRSRDLVALSGAVIWELDEHGRIGFVSPQLAELLDLAPADLTGTLLETLVAPDHQENFQRAVNAARSDNSIERIDLALLHRDREHQVPVVLRVRALKDTVHGLSGFRISTVRQGVRA